MMSASLLRNEKKSFPHILLLLHETFKHLNRQKNILSGFLISNNCYRLNAISITTKHFSTSQLHQNSTATIKHIENAILGYRTAQLALLLWQI